MSNMDTAHKTLQEIWYAFNGHIEGCELFVDKTVKVQRDDPCWDQCGVWDDDAIEAALDDATALANNYFNNLKEN